MHFIKISELEYTQWVYDEPISREILEKYFNFSEFRELENYGVVIKVWHISEVDRKWLFLFASDCGDLVKFGIGGGTGRGIPGIGDLTYGTHFGVDSMNYYLDNGYILLELYKYGGGNKMYFPLKLKEFVEMPFHSHTIQNQRLLENYYDIDYEYQERRVLPLKYFNDKLTDGDKIKILQDILKYKLKLKRKKL